MGDLSKINVEFFNIIEKGISISTGIKESFLISKFYETGETKTFHEVFIMFIVVENNSKPRHVVMLDIYLREFGIGLDEGFAGRDFGAHEDIEDFIGFFGVRDIDTF